MVAFQYIAPDALPALHSYKYSGVDNSLVAKYIMQPYWYRCEQEKKKISKRFFFFHGHR